MGIDGVSIGSNDLTQLMLGVDRDSEVCAELFDESDEAVVDAIARIIAACREVGITSISVNPDAVDRARRVAAAAERRLLLDTARARLT